VLSIDGGGIRGLIPAVVLAAIEGRCGKPIAEVFDLMVGTSTGGILALALARPDRDGRPMYPAEELIGLYEDDGPKIFRRSLVKRVLSANGLLDERYDSDALRESLIDHLGDARLRDTLSDVFVTAYELRRRQAFFFRSARAKGSEAASEPPEAYDFAMADVALATSAAPTYFEPVEIESSAREIYALIDGGVFATNPAMCAYAEWRKTGAAGELVLVSLGTGTPGRQHGIDVGRAKRWGELGWARPIIDVVFDGVSDTVEFQLGQLLGSRYVRLQAKLTLARPALDDASPANLRNLRRQGEELVAASGDEIERICRLLV
jgi:predicted acylesterase/phospholipase RssA